MVNAVLWDILCDYKGERCCAVRTLVTFYSPESTCCGVNGFFTCKGKVAEKTALSSPLSLSWGSDLVGKDGAVGFPRWLRSGKILWMENMRLN